jgi:hypothetical protein
VVIAVLLAVVIVPLSINSDRIERTAVREANVRAVAEHWATAAGWSVVGVTSAAGRIYVATTGPSPQPNLAVLSRDLHQSGLGSLDVQVSLVVAEYTPVPR